MATVRINQEAYAQDSMQALHLRKTSSLDLKVPPGYKSRGSYEAHKAHRRNFGQLKGIKGRLIEMVRAGNWSISMCDQGFARADKIGENAHQV